MSRYSELFQLKCILKNINIITLSSYIESGVKQLLALITSNSEIILHYTYAGLSPVVKRIPWFNDSNKVISAICFDPTATWLLIVSVDGSLYILPALSLVDKKQKIDCKWALNDLTHFSKHSVTPNVKPTCVTWWQTLDCNQNTLVGYENGAIALISLTDGRCLGSCTVNEPVTGLSLCHSNNSEPVSLLITGQSGQQWRLLLETQALGCLWPPEINSQNEETTKSRLHGLKQVGDKIASIKQKLTESRSSFNDNQSQCSDTSTESSHSDYKSTGPELLPHLCDTYFAPQFARDRHLFLAFYKPSSLLTVHTFSIESAPLYVYKLHQKTKTVLLTDLFIYTVNENNKEIRVVSSYLSESRLEGDSAFNRGALIDKFKIDEQILEIYKHSDLTTPKTKDAKDSKNRFLELPKTVDDLNIVKPKVDTCIVVTEKSVYKIVLSTCPVHKFVHYVTVDNDLVAAEKLSMIFRLNIQQLLESCGDLMIAKGAFHSGIIMYKQAKVHLLKRVLKLAVASDCRTLLKFVHLCLSVSRVDMSVTTKIHIGNLAVMAYTELILRYGGAIRVSNTKDFMKFLCYEEYYDQVLAVNVACQVGLWNIVSLLARARGLQPEVVTAFGQILQSARAPRPNDHNFLLALSEPSLTQSLLISPLSSQNIFQYIRANLDLFPLDILQRFVIQLDPSQPSAIPLVSRIFQSNRFSSSLDTAFDSADMENPDRTLVSVKDFIETFLLVLMKITSKTDNTRFSLDLIHEIKQTEEIKEEEDEVFIEKLPDLTPLSAGYKHAAVVRNGNVYTMGLASSGCLGTGPLLSHSSPPKIVHMLTSLKVEALSVSCGRKHTLVLTDYGVYSWGSNSHGQLGLGRFIQESPYPQMITELAALKVVEVVSGQYHSLALTSLGSVYSWGWGIHGQLGHGTCNDQYIPKLLDFDQPVMQIAAGHAHSLLLTCDGRLFGFGSNVFGQLECCTIDSNKTSRPVLVALMPDMFVPIRKIATSYFHNIAIREDEAVYVWGASPQEVRLAQSKTSQKQGSLPFKIPELSKLPVKIYSGEPRRPIEKITIGCKHTAFIQNGRILAGLNKDDELSSPKLPEQDSLCVFNRRFIHVSCGLDYTLAIDNTGKTLAWGCHSAAQTILGKPHEETNSSSGGKVLVLRSTKRVIRIPNALEVKHFPVEVPGIPAMAITFGTTPYRNLSLKRLAHCRVLSIENASKNNQGPHPNNETSSSQDTWKNFNMETPKIECGQKTLHFALQLYYGIYDTENILLKCLDMGNYQAASKIAMLDGHYGDSLGFQLTAFKKHLESIDFNSFSLYMNKDDYDVNEKNQGNIELKFKEKSDENIEKNIVHPSVLDSQAYILSSSSSLDSIRQWGDDVEHQGGQESPCEVADIGEIKQNITGYVHALENSDGSISSVSKILHDSDSKSRKEQNREKDSDPKDSRAKEIIDIASYIVEFYTEKIHSSENHILMQNILLKCIEFWLGNNLPVAVLEKILLKNMDKYFYPLSILLFCKNFDSTYEEDIVKRDEFVMKSSSANFLKEFSNKFCLQLCSMVLENVNKA